MITIAESLKWATCCKFDMIYTFLQHEYPDQDFRAIECSLYECGNLYSLTTSNLE